MRLQDQGALISGEARGPGAVEAKLFDPPWCGRHTYDRSQLIS